jgi:tetratricopeptide (TPR) repeat protein
MTNVHDILERARASGQRLPEKEAAVLFAAAVRLAATKGATLRGRLVQIDDAGVLHLAPFDDQAPEDEPGYLAPELRDADAPRKSEPRVQVYAAGALGYELLTGHPLAEGTRITGSDLSGPLGDIVRLALAVDRRERFGDLTQLQDAVEGVQPRLAPEAEKKVLQTIRTRAARSNIEKEALAKVIEKLAHLEAQLALAGKAWSRIDGAQRQALERLDRFESGLQRVEAQARQKPSLALPIIATGLLGAAIGAAAVVFAPALSRQQPAAAEQQQAPPLATAAPALPLPPPAPAADAAVAVAGKEKPAAAEGASALSTAIDASVPDASVALAPDAGATKVAESAVAEPPQRKPPQSPPPARRRRNPEATRAEMVHAVALSQVKRGESALERSRLEEAVESFKAALDNEPNIAVAWRGLGMAYAMQGKDALALKSYQKYLQLAPGSPDAAEIRSSIAELKSRSKIGSSEEK